MRRRSIKTVRRKKIKRTKRVAKKDNVKFFMISYQGNKDFAKLSQKLSSEVWV